MFEYTPGTITGEENPYALTEIARTTTNRKDLRTLAEVGNGYAQKAVASNEYAPVDVLAILATSSNRYVRRAVALNEKSDEAILRLLAEDENSWVRQAVAAHPAAPQDVLLLLASDDNPFVCRNVAKHPEADADALHAVALSGYTYAMYQVAVNSSTAVETLTLLSDETDRWVLYGLARNPHTPSIIRNSTKVKAAVAALKAMWAEHSKVETVTPELEGSLLDALPDDDDDAVSDVTDDFVESLLSRLAA